MARQLRVMCWNIALGSYNDLENNRNGELPGIVTTIRVVDPDVVFINEARVWHQDIDQIKYIAYRTRTSFYQWGRVDNTGITGHLVVAVLSKFPLGQGETHLFPVPSRLLVTNPFYAQFGVLKTSFVFNNVVHHIFSTRYDAYDQEYNEQGVRRTTELIQSLDPAAPVIIGGDFNANKTSPHMRAFIATNRLIDVFGDQPHDRIDLIFFRGPYAVFRAKNPDTGYSDHGYVVADLVPNDAAYVRQSVPSDIIIGQRTDVSVTMRNTGDAPWTAADGFKLGSQFPDNWGQSSVTVPATVEPGAEVTFSFAITGSHLGTFYFQWRMLQEGFQWFGPRTSRTAITVRPAGYELTLLREKVRTRAFHIWLGRVRSRGPGDAPGDWFAARAELGVPPEVYL
jgi:endonuclease/exonuclease/phosphatase family metal-dependent hydrolase